MVEWRCTTEAMGTLFEVRLRGEDPEHLESVGVAALGEIRRLDRLLSPFDSQSEIRRICREGRTRPVRIDPELFAILERCWVAKIETGGCFDVTPGQELRLDSRERTVCVSGGAAEIDPGAIGKGIALDAAGRLIDRNGVTSGLLNGGTSSILAFGNQVWPIDLRHPLATDTSLHSPVGRIELQDQAFSASVIQSTDGSGDIIDPRTAAPLRGVAACFVISKSATEAEVLSTALLVMGRDGATNYMRCRTDIGMRALWYADDCGLTDID